LRVELEDALVQANRQAAAPDPDGSAEGLRLRAVNSARSALIALRRSGEIGDAAFHRLEEEMDRMELSAA
jgi:CPA1 family monovalent cation:H+ antiporter